MRLEPRDAVVGQGVLTWDEGSGARQARVEVRNISDNGVQLAAVTHLSAGTKAYLTGEQFRCIGTVRYCQRDGLGFLLGLEFHRSPNYKDSLGC